MKKGFTLIELLAVIIILALIFMVSIPVVIKIIETIKLEAYSKQENSMVNSAELYISMNEIESPQNVGDYIVVSLSDLYSKKLISEVVDPNNSSNICNGYVVIIKQKNNTMTYYPYLDCGTSYRSVGYTTELYPTGNIKLHLDSSVIKATNNEQQSSWPDISGLNREVVQSNKAKQPIIKNGVFHFDGVDDALVLDNADGGFNVQDEITWAMVYRVGDNHRQYNSIMGYRNNNWDVRMDSGNYFRFHSYNQESEWPPCSDLHKDDSLNSLLEGWVYIIYIWDANTGIKKGFINGVKVMNGTMRANTQARDLTGLNFSIGSVNDGGLRNFSGDIAEIIIYDRAITDTEAAELGDYFIDKWFNTP